MAGITMPEAMKLIETPLKRGIIETIARESTVLELLPIVGINGNAFSYVQETSTGSVGFRAVNEDYNHTNPTHTQKTEKLRRLGSKVEVDRFIELTQNINDVRAEATSLKSKAIANEFTRVFFKGNSGTNDLEFDGLDIRMLPEQEVDADGAELNADHVSHLLDLVQGGADVLFMNKRTRRKMTALFSNQQSFIQAGQDAFGRPQQYFGEVRIAVVDDAYIPDNSIYAVKFGQDQGISGIQAGELQAVDNGLRGTMYETLIEWYVSIIDGNPKGFARLKNISLTPVTA
ncbi:major capsid protein [Priestia megaterium]|uniref:major capsid protein n=1 Tax=Priestia megaterium TaxID=1404 RepID=UPI0023D99348|nr:phage major capsid protein [Priestia megaterium]MDF2010202.1 phage major capsid protein [Priestia megaterium]